MVAAADLTQDTNEIESLSVEQARKLAAEFPGVEAEFEIGIGAGRRVARRCLPLGGLKQLDPDVAKALAGYRKGPLLLAGLTTLNADTVKALAGSTWLFVLPKLTALDADAAKAIAELEGALLSLVGLTALDTDTARSLAAFKGQRLYLDGLTALDADAAKALAAFTGDGLALNGLKMVDGATAKALAEFKGRDLYLNGLTVLDADAGMALVEFKGQWLGLYGLTTLDAETAIALAMFGGKVRLPFERFGDDKMPLTAEVARLVVASRLFSGSLPALTAFESPDSVAIAKALAARQGTLSLPNLKKISAKTLTALIEKRDVAIPAIETLELIQEPDGSATEDFVIPEWLEKRQRLGKGR